MPAGLDKSQKRNYLLIVKVIHFALKYVLIPGPMAGDK